MTTKNTDPAPEPEPEPKAPAASSKDYDPSKPLEAKDEGSGLSPHDGKSYQEQWPANPEPSESAKAFAAERGR